MTLDYFEEQKRPTITANLNALTKFENTIAPTAYLNLLEDQLAMSNMTAESEKIKVLPMMLAGKTSYFADQLR